MTMLESPTHTRPELVAAYAEQARKVYGEGDTQVVALDSVDIAFGAGEFTAIMGPSGSGKSTLMHSLAGLDRLTSGRVVIGDVDLSVLSEKELTLLRRTKIGFVFQAFNLIPTLTAAENITLPIDLGKSTLDMAWFDEVVRAVGLNDRLGHKPNELSGGQQQRVAVARALASRPEVVFADEPTGNLDSTTGAAILQFMADAVRQYQQTIVMVTHDPVAASYADRVVFLADGQIRSELRDPSTESILQSLRSTAQNAPSERV